MYKRFAVYCLVIVSLGFFLLTGGCQRQTGEAIPDEGNTAVEYAFFRVGMVEDILSLDPARVTSYGEMQLLRVLYETLFTIEADTQRVLPLLVESWEVSPDQQTYSFQLKKGIKFHSGRELTAGDVKFSWERIVSLGSPGDLASVFMTIQGAENYAEGRTEHMEGLVVKDPYTLEVVLEQPYQQFLTALAHPAAAIVDMEVVQLVGDTYGEPGTFQSPTVVLAGTGPFSMVEWIGGHLLTLQGFPQYHGKKPGIDRLEVSQYPDVDIMVMDFTGQYLDLVITPCLPEETGLLEDETLPVQETDLYYLGINPEKKPFDNQVIRKAVSSAVNRDLLATEYCGGVPLEGLLPRSQLQGNPPRLRHSYEDGQVNNILSNDEKTYLAEYPLVLTVGPGEKWRLMATRIQSQLEKAGFSVRLEILDADAFSTAVSNGQAGLFLDFWQCKLPSPELFLESNFASWGLNNWSHFVHPEVDDRLKFLQGDATGNQERLAALLDIEELLQEEGILVSLFGTKRNVIVQEYVKNVQLLPLGLVAWESINLEGELQKSAF